ncbi:MAG: amidase family protein, partial [Gemmatimonadaceae bacterium]
MNSRRQFLIRAPIGLLGAAAACRGEDQKPDSRAAVPGTPATPGAPPAFNTAPPVGPEVSATTFAESEKLMQVQMTDAQRRMAAGSWRTSMAALLERRTGPRKLPLDATLAPATRWDPGSIGVTPGPTRDRFVRSSADPGPLPASDDEIAYAPVTRLSRWIETRKLSSDRLTRIYLDRIARFDPKLRCVITLTTSAALAQAKEADAEIAAGKYRGPLHGVPFGVKDLLDTAGIATTYGAEPFRNRVPTADSAVVARLRAAGAVLVAKLSMGALALNDIWFGGQTMNPWL